MADRLSVDPESVARDGAEINELAAEVRAIHRWFIDSADALGQCWGDGDAVAKSFEKKYLPARERFDVFLQALGTAFEKTAEGTVDTAKQFARSEQYGIDAATRLGGFQGGAPGGGKH
ncbi:hypothetical protein GCM10007079_06390 [Nocardiopsis terrae]|uniref:WXG100 family type VII secretion target n=1 Tax=Nocardiopsis terrae TaxID=372655 RepID=A0ABR9HNT1_9ACTN|nr:hypothetical protein [Nocardiopsis terrae]MBE1460686.1 hypothetical protein [Nocardiopsis terrae]GHC72887.1 hypothetical protein GCM10007079_06390 [Nocardiopsis terrae]